MQESLNDLYTRYAANLLKKHDFEAAIYTKIREDIDCFGMTDWTKEDIDDCISTLYQRLGRAIDNYHYTGSSFETYISAVVRMAAKEFQILQYRNYVEENAAWTAQIPEMYACESEAWYDSHFTNDQSPDAAENLEKVKNPRQMLILLLKCSNHISADSLERIASRLDIDSTIVKEMICHLKQYQEERDAKITALRERANRQFYRCILFEKRLKVMQEDSDLAIELKKKLAREQERLRISRKFLLRTRSDPSNHQIAKLLGISKSTVDSTLYSLRKQHRKSPE